MAAPLGRLRVGQTAPVEVQGHVVIALPGAELAQLDERGVVVKRLLVDQLRLLVVEDHHGPDTVARVHRSVCVQELVDDVAADDVVVEVARLQVVEDQEQGSVPCRGAEPVPEGGHQALAQVADQGVIRAFVAARSEFGELLEPVFAERRSNVAAMAVLGAHGQDAVEDGEIVAADAAKVDVVDGIASERAGFHEQLNE